MLMEARCSWVYTFIVEQWLLFRGNASLFSYRVGFQLCFFLYKRSDYVFATFEQQNLKSSFWNILVRRFYTIVFRRDVKWYCAPTVRLDSESSYFGDERYIRKILHMLLETSITVHKLCIYWRTNLYLHLSSCDENCQGRTPKFHTSPGFSSTCNLLFVPILFCISKFSSFRRHCLRDNPNMIFLINFIFGRYRKPSLQLHKYHVFFYWWPWSKCCSPR